MHDQNKRKYDINIDQHNWVFESGKHFISLDERMKTFESFDTLFSGSSFLHEILVKQIKSFKLKNYTKNSNTVNVKRCTIG